MKSSLIKKQQKLFDGSSAEKRLNIKNSSLIKEATYNRLYNKLSIVFKNSPEDVYVYSGVSEETIEEFENSKSKGSYFQNYIKENYTTLKMTIVHVE